MHTPKRGNGVRSSTHVFAYNTSRHEASRFTPFELMFSRRATFPIDLNIKKSTPEQEVLCYANMDEPDLLQLAKKRVEREEAKTNILTAQKRSIMTGSIPSPISLKMGSLFSKRTLNEEKKAKGWET